MGKEINNIVLVTGSSGAGKSIALKALEDLGYDAVDNIPLSVLPVLINSFPKDDMLAIGVDARNQNFTPEKFLEVTKGFDFELLLLDADTDMLIRRFSETRRRHPLAKDRPVADGIKLEKHMMKKLKVAADFVVDTSNFSQTDLRNWVRGNFGKDKDNLQVTINSFSYKRGVPREADLVFDTRFLHNPFYEEELKMLDGRSEKVRDFVKKDKLYGGFMENLKGLVLPLLPAYKKAGKTYLTIAIGCTGGQHRSVCVAEELASAMKADGVELQVRHRDV